MGSIDNIIGEYKDTNGKKIEETDFAGSCSMETTVNLTRSPKIPEKEAPEKCPQK